MKACINPSCDYTKKNGAITDVSVTYCPNCGNTLVIQSQDVTQVLDAPRGVRMLAGIIDLTIDVVFVSIGAIPGINIFSALISTLFWLLRDIKGASPGKSIMGLEVRTQGGAKPSNAALMLRNLPFTPLIIQIIPVVGNIILPLTGVIIVAEFFFVLAFNRRLGDLLAGTKIVKKQATPLRATVAGSSY